MNLEVCEVGLILFLQKCTNLELTMIYTKHLKIICSYIHNKLQTQFQ